jgi:hypothetical protein
LSEPGSVRDRSKGQLTERVSADAVRDRGRVLGGDPERGGTSECELVVLSERMRNRVWVQTSSDDHPHALSNYERRGFRAFRVAALCAKPDDSE